MKKPRFHQNVNVTIHDIGSHGEGIGYWHGYTLFVDGALPGEVIRARIVESRRNFGRAKLTTLLQSSPDRIAPVCPYYAHCGSCQLMHLTYEKQLKLKEEFVKKALQKEELYEESWMLKCHPSPKCFHYRNKIQLPIRKEEGKMEAGFYARLSQEFIPISGCMIHEKRADALCEAILQDLQNSDISIYDPKTHIGSLRSLLIRYASHTNEALIVFVVNDQQPDAILQKLSFSWMERFCEKNVVSENPISEKDLPEKQAHLQGVLQNCHTEQDNTVLGSDFIVLAGKDTMKEKIGEYFFFLSASSFFQINVLQIENIYQRALELAHLTGTEIVLDAYCGVGTISLFFAKKAKKVIGLESNALSIENAKNNAAYNKVDNVEFFATEVETKIQELNAIDIAILNPPRKGSEPSVLEKLKALQVKKILYISCNPISLAHDLKVLSPEYNIQTIECFDMFAQTAHVEVLAYLERKEESLDLQKS